ncbi:MAG: type transport system ATP-binding protein [Gaiellaceae bacterium]|jgi:ABC-type polysaccharide/polyol phosphate transport system ATPase subunit|nr:type transport system ATP-binding protein [Gaiellaceae bacterium]
MTAVELRDVSFAYRLHHRRSGTFKEHAIHALGGQGPHVWHWALRDVSVTVEPGAVLAVVGPNGAGKSTLLKLIARVLPPTSGRVVVRGLVAPLIELGAGFDAELTGEENLVLYGAMLGHHPRVLRRRAAAVAEWAGLEDFMDVPLRSYSSGMLARLGFAVATEARPDVLLVDEVLAVGDAAFQIRSRERIDEIIRGGTAVVLVSHALDAVCELADEVVWLDGGRVLGRGEPAAVTTSYRDTVTA